MNEISENERTKFIQNFPEFHVFSTQCSAFFAKVFHYRKIFVQFSVDKNRNFSISYQENFIFARKIDFEGISRISRQFRSKFGNPYIYLMFFCLFVSNKRQNCRSDLASEKVYGSSKLQNMSIIVKLWTFMKKYY